MSRTVALITFVPHNPLQFPYSNIFATREQAKDFAQKLGYTFPYKGAEADWQESEGHRATRDELTFFMSGTEHTRTKDRCFIQIHPLPVEVTDGAR